MAQYSQRSFLKQVSPDLMEEFFGRHGSMPVEGQEDDRDAAGQYLQRLESLPKKAQRQAEHELRLVYDMATETGIQRLVDEGHFRGEELAEELESLALPDKALRILISRPQLFFVASKIHTARKLSARHWRIRMVPVVKPDVSLPAMDRLKKALSKDFWSSEGRGKRSTIERYLVNGVEHFVLVFLDDYAANYLRFDESDNLVRQFEKGAFEVIFVYNEETGSIELWATGDKKRKEKLFSIFSTIVLGVPLGASTSEPDPYDLSRLASKQFHFATAPSDGIERVRVKELRVIPMGWQNERIDFDAGGRGDRRDARAMIESYLDQTRIPLDSIRVAMATIEIWLAPHNGHRPPKFSFDISPRSCNLKNHPEPERHLAEKYLREWKIARA